MKILIIQENGRHKENKFFRECYSIQRAFHNLGHEAVVWGLNHQNFSKKISFDDYDLIFNLENYDTSGWVPDLKHTTAYKILWSIDAHCRGVGVFDITFNNGKYNLLLHSTRDFALGKNRVWFPNAYDDSLIKRLDNVKKEHFIGFCGNYVNRKGLIDFISSKFSIKKDIFVIGDEMVKAVNSYKIHFNKNMANDINYRNFETIGCSTMLLVDYNYQFMMLGFKEMENVVFYRTVDELYEKINFLKDNEDLIRTISENGYELSKKHTYKRRISSLLKYIEGKI
jgi:hypothetical protein